MVRLSSGKVKALKSPDKPTEIYGFNITARYSKKADLASYLTVLHESLVDLEQDVMKAPRGMPVTVEHLISSKLLSHNDKEVRVLVGCCLADVLRVYAPEAPYKDSDMVIVFEFLVSQLRALSTVDIESTVGQNILYILKSLATVKSCVVPVILAQNKVPGADEVVISLFETVVEAVAPEHSDEILMRFSEILHACVEENEGVSEVLLDILLKPLLPNNKKDNPTAYRICAAVVRAVTPWIRKTFSDVVQGILIGSGASSRYSSLEIADEMYPLIYELHAIAPDLLSEVIPFVCQQLRVEEEKIRLNAVNLLGTLFTSTVDYVSAFPRDFREFLARLNDLTVKIRLEVVECCGKLLKLNRVDISTMDDLLSKRLRDPDEVVRISALKIFLDYGMDNLLSLSAATMREIGERAKDKRPDIRRVALDGLCKLYFRHISSKLVNLSAPLDFGAVRSLISRSERLSDVIASISEIPRGVVERLSFIPSALIKAYGFPETFSRHKVVQLFQEYVLPKMRSQKAALSSSKQHEAEDSLEESVDDLTGSDSHELSSDLNEAIMEFRRPAALLFAFDQFDDSDKHFLSVILSLKAQCWDDLSVFLLARSNSRSEAQDNASASESEQRHELQMKQALLSLLQHLPPLERRGLQIDKLLTQRDQRIYRLLGEALDFSANADAVTSARDDLGRRLTSKSPISQFCVMLCDFASPMIVNRVTAKTLFSLFNDLLSHFMSSSTATATATVTKGSRNSLSVDSDVSSLLLSIASLLTYLSRFAARAFSGCCVELYAIFKLLSENRFISVESSLMNQVWESMHTIVLQCGRYLDIEEKHLTALVSQMMGNLNLESSIPAQRLVQCAEVMNELVFATVSCTSSPVSSTNFLVELMASFVSERWGSSSSAELWVDNDNISAELQSLIALTSISASAYASVGGLRKCSIALLHAFPSSLRRSTMTLISERFLPEERFSASCKALALRLWAQLVLLHFESKSVRRKHKHNKDQDANVAGSKRSKSGQSQRNRQIAENADENETGNSDEAGEDEEYEVELNRLIAVIFNVMQSDGKLIMGCAVDGKEEAREADSETPSESVHAAAVWSALQLLRLRDISQRLSVAQWLQMHWSLLSVVEQRDPQPMVFALMTLMHTHPVHIKFLSLCCVLFADCWKRSEESKNKEQASNAKECAECLQKVIVAAVRKLRITQEDIADKLLMLEDQIRASKGKAAKALTAGNGESGIESLSRRRERYHSLASLTMAENALPYLLYALSYHPQFPQDASLRGSNEAQRVKVIAKAIQCLLSALQSTLRTENGNLPYLFKQLHGIATESVDREDKENVGIHFVAKLTSKMLQQFVRTAENLQVYPNEVVLPKELFQKIVSTSTSQSGSASKAQRITKDVLMMSVSDAAIDKAMQVVQDKTKAAAILKRVKSPSRQSLGSPEATGQRAASKPRADEEIAESDNNSEAPPARKRSRTSIDKSAVANGPTRTVLSRSAKLAPNYYQDENSDEDSDETEEPKPRKPKVSGAHSQMSHLTVPSRKPSLTQELFDDMDILEEKKTARSFVPDNSDSPLNGRNKRSSKNAPQLNGAPKNTQSSTKTDSRSPMNNSSSASRKSSGTVDENVRSTRSGRPSRS